MLSNRLLRDHPDVVRVGLRRRDDAEGGRALEEWLRLDGERSSLAGSGAAADKLQRARLIEIETHMRALALRLPNLPDARVPDGLDAAHNLELRRWGEIIPLPFPALTHEQLATAL